MTHRRIDSELWLMSVGIRDLSVCMCALTMKPADDNGHENYL